MIPYPARAAAKRVVTRSLGRLLAGGETRIRFACLCYHSVCSADSYLSLSPSTLTEHIRLLRNLGFRFVTVGEIASEIISRRRLVEPTIALSFDDGFKDNLTHVLPILQSSGIRATFFVTAGLAAARRSVVSRYHEITSYPTEYLNGADLRELKAAGMEIGAHTYSHPNLAKLGRGAVLRELRISRDYLEQTIGSPVEQFAYPFGKRGIHYTDSTVAMVKACGYRAAAAVEFRSVPSLEGLDPFQIPRFFVTREDSPATLKEKVEGGYNWLGWFQATSPSWLKALVSPEDARV